MTEGYMPCREGCLNCGNKKLRGNGRGLFVPVCTNPGLFACPKDAGRLQSEIAANSGRQARRHEDE
jgi:ferredoxin